MNNISKKIQQNLSETVNDEVDFDYIHGPFEKALDNSVIGNWKVDIDNMSGTYYIRHKKMDDTYVMATPFWEDEDGIVIDVAHEDETLTPKEFSALGVPLKSKKMNQADKNYSVVLQFNLTSNPQKDKNEYIRIMRPIVDKVEKELLEKK